MAENKIIKKMKEYKKKSVYRNNIIALGVFGSYSIGNFNKKSDIDVFVQLEKARMFDLIGIKHDLEKILGKKVDIVALRESMNEYLKNQIKQNGQYV
jgi:hypothetical protein